MTFRDTTCNNTFPYTFKNTSKVFTSGGTKIDSFKTNTFNCDSIITYILSVKDTSTSTTNSTVCDSIVWNGTKYTSSGTYVYHTNNSAGCDSTAKLNLTVNNSSLTELTYHICINSGGFSFEDSLFTVSGIHYYKYTGSNGCDSTIKINLFIDLLPSDTTHRSINWCQGIPYRGTLYSVGVHNLAWGDYQNQAGCHSIVVITLIVHPKSSSFIDTSVCQGQLPFTWHSKNVNHFGNYNFTTSNQWGCDSIVTLRLNKIKADTTIRRDTICGGDSILINGIYYSQQGIYFIKYSTALSCDSVVELHLTVKQATSSTTTVTICNNCDYVWNSNIYNIAGIYSIHLNNAVGCDSVATLILEKGMINGSTTVCLFDTVCFSVKPSSNIASYSWQLNTDKAELISDDSTCFKVVFTTLDTVPIILSAYDTGNHYLFTDTQFVVVNKNPNPLISTINRVGCQSIGNNIADSLEGVNPLPVILSDSICLKVCEYSRCSYFAIGKLGSTYNWVVSGGTKIFESRDSLIVVWGGIGSGTITLYETTSAGCIGKQVICTEIIQKPIASFGAGSTIEEDMRVISICRGQNLNFFDHSTSSTSSPVVNWYWDFGDGFISKASSPSHQFNTTGTFVVHLTVTNQCNCKSMDSLVVTVSGTNTSFISCEGVVCEGSTHVYTISPRVLCASDSLGGNPLNPWTIIGGTIIPQIPVDWNTVTVVWNAPPSDGFGFVGFNNRICGNRGSCPFETNIKIPIIKTTGTTIDGPTTICQNSTNLYRLPAWPGTEYKWTTSEGTLIHTNNGYEIGLQIGTGSGNPIKLICTYYNSISFCSGADTLNIDVYNSPKITGSSVMCQYDTSTFDLVGSADTNWHWIITMPNGSLTEYYDKPLVFIPTLAGDYTIVTTTNSLCAAPSFKFKVNMLPNKPDSIIGVSSVCKGQPYHFAVANPNSNIDYKWYCNNNNITFLGNSNGTDIDVQFLNDTSWILGVNASNKDNTCTNMAATEKQIKILNITNNLIDFDSIVCPDSRKLYTASFIGADAYEWSIFPAGVGSVERGDGTRSITILWNHNFAVSQATIRVKIRKCGVAQVFSYTVYTATLPSLSLVHPDSICRNSTFNVNLVSIPTITNVNAVWNFGNGEIVAGNGSMYYAYTSPIISTTPYNITATINNFTYNGCQFTNSYSVSSVIYVKPTPSISISPSGNIKISAAGQGTTPLTAIINNAYGDYDELTWYIPQGDYTCQKSWGCLGETATDVGSYSVTITNLVNGCSSSSNIVNVSIKDTSSPTNCTFSLGKPEITIADLTSTAANFVANCGNVHLQASTNSTNYTLYNWGWEANDASLISGSGQNFYGIFGNVGLHIVTVGANVIDDSGMVCVVKKDTLIVVPVASYISRDIICKTDGTGYITTLTDNSFVVPTTTITSYDFYIDGSIANSSTSNSFTTSSLLPNTTHTVYLITKYTYDGYTYSCQSATRSISIPKLPTASFSVSPKRCEGIPIQFTYNDNYNDITSYFWKFDDGSSSAVQDPARVYTGAAGRNASLTVTNNYGCTITSSQNITVIQNKLIGIIDPSGVIRICPNTSKTLEYKKLTGDNGTDYFWFNERATNFQAPIATTSVPYYDVNSNGAYWVRVENTYGCFKNADRNAIIIKEPLPQPKIVCKSTDPATTDTLFICQGLSFILNISNYSTMYQYDWQLYDQASTTWNSINQYTNKPYEYNGANNLAPGAYRFKVTSFYINCSLTSKEFVVVVMAKPATPIVNPPVALDCQKYIIQLSINNPQQGVYVWSSDTSGSSITVKEGGVYKVWFYNGLNCMSDTTVYVPINPKNYFWMLPNGCYNHCLPDSGISIDVPHFKFDRWQWYVNNIPLNGGTNSVLQPLQIVMPGSYSLLIDNGVCIDSAIADPINYSEPIGCHGEVSCAPSLMQIGITNTIYNASCDSVTINFTIFNDNGSSNKPAVPFFIFSTLGSNVPGGVANWGMNTYSITLPISTNTSGDTLLFRFFANGVTGLVTCEQTIVVPILCTTGNKINYASSTSSFTNLTHSSNGLVIVPNPATNYISVLVNDVVTKGDLQIIDIFGRIVLTQTLHSKLQTIDIHNLKKGMYIVQVKQQSGSISTAKLIVE